MTSNNRDDHLDLFEGEEIISKYTRAQAIEDGVLIDVSTVAKEAGFLFPVAVSAGVWARCIEVPPGVECQDEAGRLWDVLHLLRIAIHRNASGDRVDFAIHVRNDNRERIPPLVQLWALCGPGEDAEPVITVMLPDED